MTKERRTVCAKSELPSLDIPHTFDLAWDKLPTHDSYRDIYLVRHGQYMTREREEENRVLTELGREQARLTGKWMREMGINPDEFAQSTIIRARQTAELILAEISDLVDSTAVQNPTDLLCEGLPYVVEPPTQWSRSFGESYARYLFDDGNRIEAAFRKYIHRGFTFQSFFSADVRQSSPKVAVIVCHGNVIRYFVMRAMQVDPSAWLRITLHHGSVTKMRVFGNGDIRIYTVGESSFMPFDKLSA